MNIQKIRTFCKKAVGKDHVAHLKLYGGSHPDIDSLIQTAYTVADDIGIRFKIDKCGVFAMHRGKESKCEGIAIGSGKVIGEVDDDGYKY